MSVSQTHGWVHTVDSSAIFDGDKLHVFATHRSLDAHPPLRITLADRPIASILDCEVVTGDDPKAENSLENPDQICAVKFQQAAISAGAVEARLPRLTVAAMSFALG